MTIILSFTQSFKTDNYTIRIAPSNNFAVEYDILDDLLPVSQDEDCQQGIKWSDAQSDEHR